MHPQPASGVRRRAKPIASPAFEALLYDHDEAVLNDLCRRIRRKGFTPTIANSSDHLIALLETGTRFQLILLDLDAPVGDLMSTLTAVRRIDHQVAVIGTSGKNDAHTVVEFLRHGGTDFLTNPVSDDDLDAVVFQHVEDRFEAPATQAGEEIVIPGSAMARVMEVAEHVAASTAPVVLLGETGVGKGVVAQAIHDRSPRARERFITVLCTAVPHHLVESELFGYVKGAFTDATSNRPGKFALAHRGTIFLDEIGDLSLDFQAKLLQVLDDGTYTPIGSNRERRVDAHVICATHQDLSRAVREGRFRSDLFHRINVVNLWIPPLRERRDEILPLLRRFSRQFSEMLGKPRPTITKDFIRLLQHQPFPGNVRELQNIARRLVLFQDEQRVIDELIVSRRHIARTSLSSVLQEMESLAGKVPLLEAGRRAAFAIEHGLIEQALLATMWNRRRAARVLNLSYGTLLQKMREFAI
jgi:two-component system response regulator AtoC